MLQRMMTRVGAWLGSNGLLKIFVGSLVLAVVLVGGVATDRVGAIAEPVREVAPLTTHTLIAYNVDLEMDKARVEKTVEHYGEPIRDIVEKAAQNNENAPDSKSTAENSYERESPLNDVLPERVGKKFSQSDLQDMEKNMDR